MPGESDGQVSLPLRILIDEIYYPPIGERVPGQPVDRDSAMTGCFIRIVNNPGCDLPGIIGSDRD